MAVIREKQAHLWERDPHDWYVEPYECSAALFSVEEFEGSIWDPACGIGRIVESARSAGFQSIGTDLVSRGPICSRISDFLCREYTPEFSNIVTNPPFRLAEEFIREAIEILPSKGKLAAILPLVWLSGFSSKRDWLPRSPLKTVYPLSPRPSMPPGKVIEAGIRPGNGTKDFAWLVWQRDFEGLASVKFLNTNLFKGSAPKRSKRGGKYEQGAKEWESVE
jgi:hypothetical protein